MVFTFIAEKKIAKKFTIFFPYTKISEQKNSQVAKFRIKNFAIYISSQTSNTKEICENIVKKIFKIILAIFLYLKKNSIEIRLIFEKKNEKILIIILAIFLFLKKSRLKVG